ncbi:hypothetical protein LTR32_007292 [Rachicladosporium monterosium]|uniref:Cwf19-like protein C-terminal domain-containing protein n=1 Tax=Rachicladosporium monterosium TaxID=1507873 RepID=A0ABR0KWF8_9PEZI|nr:hypothetical protein LTR32_007292 [Rachicladosporium monterosium]
MRYSVVIGAVNGKFSEMFAKLATLHAKQNFAFAIIAGDLCANIGTAADADREELAKLLRGDITVPLSTYFALGGQSLPVEVVDILEKNEGELCPNLSVFGRKASIKTSDGFRIVAVGGAHAGSGDQVVPQYAAYYTDSDAQAVGKGLTNADIVVTSDWPAHIRDGGKSQYTVASPAETESIADLCTSLKPRYHFSASEAFYEREPFFHNGPTPRSVTRFISLAPYGNSAKQKWIYAFSLEPSADAPQNLPPGCTASPLTSIKKRLVEAGFDQEAANLNYPKFVKGFKDMEEIEEGNYFKVTIWSEALRKEMVMPLDGDFRFDLQFGRRVLGKLLGLEQRTHWKDCAQTVGEETADAEVFKEVFKKFDFGLEGEEEL